MKAIRIISITMGLVAALAIAQTQPDNTKVNKGDAKSSAVTADNSKNNKTDLKLTQDIRKAVIADKALSMYAHNVKIIVKKGMVTLRGPVRSEEEKTSIAAKAADAAGGADKVNNQITIKPAKKS